MRHACRYGRRGWSDGSGDLTLEHRGGSIGAEREGSGQRAKVAELADAPDLGSGSRKALGVRLPPFAPFDLASALTEASLMAGRLSAELKVLGILESNK